MLSGPVNDTERGPAAKGGYLRLGVAIGLGQSRVTTTTGDDDNNDDSEDHSVSEHTSTGTVTTFGHGIVRGTPDLMRVTISVETRASTVAIAYREAGERLSAVIGSLRANGVPAGDVTSSGLSVRTEQTWVDGGGSKITGYLANASLTVLLRGIGASTASSPNHTAASGSNDSTSAGDSGNPEPAGGTAAGSPDRPGAASGARRDPAAIVADCVAAGGDAVRLGGLQLTFADQESLLAKARDNAWENALAKARQYAARAGRELGRVLQVTEETSVSAPTSRSRGATEIALASAAVPIETGESEVGADIRVTWQLD